MLKSETHLQNKMKFKKNASAPSLATPRSGTAKDIVALCSMNNISEETKKLALKAIIDTTQSCPEDKASEFKEGDWICHKKGCNAHNYKARKICRKCETKKKLELWGFERPRDQKSFPVRRGSVLYNKTVPPAPVSLPTPPWQWISRDIEETVKVVGREELSNAKETMVRVIKEYLE